MGRTGLTSRTRAAAVVVLQELLDQSLSGVSSEPFPPLRSALPVGSGKRRWCSDSHAEKIVPSRTAIFFSSILYLLTDRVSPEPGVAP